MDGSEARAPRAFSPLRDLSALVPARRRRADRSTSDQSDPGQAPTELLVLSWNVFHGRDAPPDLARGRIRSVLFRRTVHNETHVQVNRSLFEEFAGVLAAARWDICLLQECPPRWADRLADECQAGAYGARTSRNWLAPMRNRIAEFNPDLMGSWEGGSNLTLARTPWQIVEAASVLLNPLPRRRLRERRRLALTRLVDRHREVCVGNLHLSAGPKQASREARRAAEIALQFARGAPLVLGGDYNLRPEFAAVFDELCEGPTLCGTTSPDGIDHILACGLDTIDPPVPWAPQRRELDVLAGLEHRRLRLSDHAPVEARFRLR